MEIWHIWAIVAILFIVGEILTSGFALVCFAVGCIGGAIGAAAGATLEWQLGTFAIATGDDGIHADGTLTVTAGTIDVSTCYEGLEALHVEVSGGDIRVKASDDGINAAGGTDQSGSGGRDQFGGSGGMGGMGGGMGSGDGSVRRKAPTRVVKIGRNDLCPCGSGQKWKKCTCKEYHS